jgi:hypothetical protein
MYLIFKTKQEAKERSLIEAMRRGCDLVLSKYWWSEPVPFKDGYATDVKDGKGLSKDELAQCVKTIEQ